MPNKLVIALLTLLLALAACSQQQTQRAPSWQGVDLLTNQPVIFPEVLGGKPAVLLFWATWCPYCHAFMRFAKAIEADYRTQGVQVITFNTKERGRGDPKAYAQGLGFPLVAIRDADKIAEAYGIEFIPGLLVVDGNGNLVYRRRSTDLPAGRTVAQQWALEVREVLDSLKQ